MSSATEDGGGCISDARVRNYFFKKTQKRDEGRKAVKEKDRNTLPHWHERLWPGKTPRRVPREVADRVALLCPTGTALAGYREGLRLRRPHRDARRKTKCRRDNYAAQGRGPWGRLAETTVETGRTHVLGSVGKEVGPRTPRPAGHVRLLCPHCGRRDCVRPPRQPGEERPSVPSAPAARAPRPAGAGLTSGLPARSPMAPFPSLRAG